MTGNDDLDEVIASFTTGKFEVEVVRISHPLIDTVYLTSQLEDGAEIKDEDGNTQTVRYSPMVISEESSGILLLNERELTISGLNDYIANEEDKIPSDNTDKISVDVMTYISDRSGVLTDIAMGPIRYFNQSTSYSQRDNAAVLSISTSPTNSSETGVKISSSIFPTVTGFE